MKNYNHYSKKENECFNEILTDKTVPMRAFMHYTDPEANERNPITVFGKAKKSLSYNYSDRLFGNEWIFAWDESLNKGLKKNSALFFEYILKKFHNVESVDLQHVLLGVNRSSGHSYMVFGYTYK